MSEIISPEMSPLVKDVALSGTVFGGLQKNISSVIAAHQQHLAAGVTRTVTASFGAVQRFNNETNSESAIEWAKLATQAAVAATSDPGNVIFTTSPLGTTQGDAADQWESLGDSPLYRIRKAAERFQAPFDAASKQRVYTVMMEACPAVEEGLAAIEAARQAGMERIIISMLPRDGGPISYESRKRLLLQDAAGALRDAGQGKVEVLIGVNCNDVAQTLELTNKFPSLLDTAHPNLIGFPDTPQGWEDRLTLFEASQDSLTPRQREKRSRLAFSHQVTRQQLKRLMNVNLKFVGLCCGSTIEHVKILKSVVDK